MRGSRCAGALPHGPSSQRSWRRPPQIGVPNISISSSPYASLTAPKKRLPTSISTARAKKEGVRENKPCYFSLTLSPALPLAPSVQLRSSRHIKDIDNPCDLVGYCRRLQNLLLGVGIEGQARQNEKDQINRAGQES